MWCACVDVWSGVECGVDVECGVVWWMCGVECGVHVWMCGVVWCMCGCVEWCGACVECGVVWMCSWSGVMDVEWSVVWWMCGVVCCEFPVCVVVDVCTHT